MKSILLLSILIVAFGTSAFAECDVKGKMANNKAITFDRSSPGRVNLTAVLAESAMRTEAGAACVEIDEQAKIFVLSSYFEVLSGPEAGKLFQVVEIFKK